ncbi:hypothetical protein C0J52_15606 [Blattella germanica]|nr:hypothetical protein C0J52_15606 [Blattella germanica]
MFVNRCMPIIASGIYVMWISIAAVIINVAVVCTICGTSGTAGIVFLIIMLSSCGGLFRYCFTGYRPQIIVHQITNFVPFPTERACPEERQPLINDDDKRTLDMPIHDQGHEDVEASLSCPDSPPPPYTASIIPGKELK